jgi:ornithine carbamoyltransferase
LQNFLDRRQLWRHQGAEMNRLISIQDLDGESLHSLIETGQRLAAGQTDFSSALKGKVVGLYFSKPSTRTRTSFFVGIQRMGGTSIFYNASDLQTSTGESLEDTGMVFGLFLDALVMRTNGSAAEMTTLADNCGKTVFINALSKTEHPTQAIADLITIQQEFGSVCGRRVVYVGAWNNTAASLVLALTRFQGTHTSVLTPEGFDPDDAMVSTARSNAKLNDAAVEFIHDPRNLPEVVDVVYTVRWRSMGEGSADPSWLNRFRGFEVGSQMWRRVSHPQTIFMHDLPAHRGIEVEAGIIDGPASRIRRQAYNKLVAGMCVLEMLLRNDDASVPSGNRQILQGVTE